MGFGSFGFTLGGGGGTPKDPRVDPLGSTQFLTLGAFSTNLSKIAEIMISRQLAAAIGAECRALAREKWSASSGTGDAALAHHSITESLHPCSQDPCIPESPHPQSQGKASPAQARPDQPTIPDPTGPQGKRKGKARKKPRQRQGKGKENT